MNCDEVVIGGVRFLGATGWTDYSATGNVPIAAWDAQQTMRDFKKIRTGDYRRVYPNDFSALSQSAKRWIKSKLDEPFEGKTVVITHHAPSLASLLGSPGAGTHLDAADANRWEHLMGPDVSLWVHGHTHHAVDYEIAGTRIISNPRGYPGQNIGFDANQIIELDV
jgi:Icc-related predicted phosphoesterase